MNTLLTQTQLPCFELPNSPFNVCPALTPTNPDPASTVLMNILSVTIGVMTLVAFLWFIFVFFTGAIGWLSSAGDKAKLQEAQKKITHGLVGLIMTISAVFIIKILEFVLGINILDIVTAIKNLY